MDVLEDFFLPRLLSAVLGKNYPSPNLLHAEAEGRGF